MKSFGCGYFGTTAQTTGYIKARPAIAATLDAGRETDHTSVEGVAMHFPRVTLSVLLGAALPAAQSVVSTHASVVPVFRRSRRHALTVRGSGAFGMDGK